MGFFDFFIRDVETSDRHNNPLLRTHYYRSEYQKTKETVINYLKRNNYKVVNIDDNYGEIFVEASSFHMIFSIRKSQVLNSSVDIKVSVYNLIAGYKPHKLIKAVYEFLDKELPVVGVGTQAY